MFVSEHGTKMAEKGVISRTLKMRVLETSSKLIQPENAS
jgi:hypothetical protein